MVSIQLMWNYSIYFSFIEESSQILSSLLLESINIYINHHFTSDINIVVDLINWLTLLISSLWMKAQQEQKELVMAGSNDSQ